MANIVGRRDRTLACADPDLQADAETSGIATPRTEPSGEHRLSARDELNGLDLGRWWRGPVCLDPAPKLCKLDAYTSSDTVRAKSLGIDGAPQSAHRETDDRACLSK